MKMTLGIIDRIVISLGLLPTSGNLVDIQTNRSIREKIGITEEESALGIVLDRNNEGNIYIKYLSEEALNYSSEVEFTDYEAKHLLACAKEADKKKIITEENYDTVIKLLSLETGDNN